MRGLISALAGAIGGAVLAVTVVFALAEHGLFPVITDTGAIHAYLLAHPDIVTEMTDKITQDQQVAQDKADAAAMKKIGLAPFFDPKIAFLTGPADAKKTLVEFYDYDCPYCRASLPAMIDFYERHKDDTRFSFIEFPIPSLHGPSATLAARVSLAARQQPDKYMAFHFALMAEQDTLTDAIIFGDAAKAGLDITKLKADMQNPAIDQALDASHALAVKAGIDGTPTFIVNGVMHPGAVDDPTLADLAKAKAA